MKSDTQKNLRWLEAFSEKIELPSESADEIISLYKKDARHIERLSEKKFNTVSCGRIILSEKLKKRKKAYTYILAAVLLKAQDTFEKYREKGINEDVFYETMKDITVWSENHRRKNSSVGLGNIMWIQNHLNCKIFRLGRLQFQPFLFYLPVYAKKRTDIKVGEKVLNVHIPQGEKLLREECEKSFRMAEEFFCDYNYKGFICESWLLCERNRDFMSEGSNIIRFSEMFEILGSSENSSQTIERVFEKKEKDAWLYPENTSLQKQCKEYILSGGKPGTGFGVRRKSKQ